MARHKQPRDEMTLNAVPEATRQWYARIAAAHARYYVYEIEVARAAAHATYGMTKEKFLTLRARSCPIAETTQTTPAPACTVHIIGTHTDILGWTRENEVEGPNGYNVLSHYQLEAKEHGVSDWVVSRDACASTRLAEHDNDRPEAVPLAVLVPKASAANAYFVYPVPTSVLLRRAVALVLDRCFPDEAATMPSLVAEAAAPVWCQWDCHLATVCAKLVRALLRYEAAVRHFARLPSIDGLAASASMGHTLHALNERHVTAYALARAGVCLDQCMDAVVEALEDKTASATVGPLTAERVARHLEASARHMHAGATRGHVAIPECADAVATNVDALDKMCARAQHCLVCHLMPYVERRSDDPSVIVARELHVKKSPILHYATRAPRLPPSAADWATVLVRFDWLEQLKEEVAATGHEHCHAPRNTDMSSVLLTGDTAAASAPIDAMDLDT